MFYNVQACACRAHQQAAIASGGRLHSMTQNYTVERVILEAVGTAVPTALTLPYAGETPRWGIVIIPGSMSSDVDGNYPSANMNPHMYADLARQLAERGHAALRYAKEGPDTGTVVVYEEKANEHPIF